MMWKATSIRRMGQIYLMLFILVAVVKSEVAFDLSLKDMQKVCSISDNGVTKECASQMKEVCSNTIWLEMFDASSKFIYPGMATSVRGDYGNFDECVKIDHKYSRGRILGKYCYPGLVIPDLTDLNNTDLNKFFKFAICMPDACSAADYNTIFQNIFQNEFPPLFRDDFCVTKESGEQFKAIDIATMIIICLTACMVICSTTYDVYLHKTETKSRHPLMIAFSVYSNGLKILQTSEGNKGQISVFHGMKTISMFWVITGHGLVAWRSLLVTDMEETTEIQKQWYFFYATAAPLAVDTFFYIGGFLLAYQYMKIKSKPLKEHLLAIPQMIIHRYLRLTPAVLMLYLVTLSFFPRMRSGPLWKPAMKQITDPCNSNPAWTFFLYIQNYYTYPDEVCIVHTWYLSADMQMFILSPLVIIPVAIMLQDTKKLRRCMVYLLCLNIVLTVLPMVTKLVFRDYGNNYDTHSRLVDYFIGVMMGVFMRERPNTPFLYNKVKHKSIVNLTIWIIILCGMLTTTICYQEVETHEAYENKAVFYSLMRPAWCIGLSWIVYSSFHGYGGIVDWFLARPIFQILGKLSYCMYLVHGLVIVYNIGNIRTRQYFSILNGDIGCGYTSSPAAGGCIS
ncbi:nose resistant to fluoxetine protein 6 isoform X2 [Leptinotarsa decemlineata]|uniref:nose resistant to fluoxetine protein 6 isoform X2 n=1 Tax=Leptinotarsa decemlineata TaxID=7539 RepID=UPI003D3073A6